METDQYPQVIQTYKGYSICKEYYAAGSHTFDWIVTKEGTSVHEIFDRLGAAKAWVRYLDSVTSS